MVAPVYSEDLSDIDLCESAAAFVAYGGGGAGLGAGVDFAIQGTNAVDKQISAATKGMMADVTGITLGADDHVFIWIFAATPGILDSFTNGGKVASIGTGATARVDFHLEGNDDRPEGGNKCYPIRYVNTAQGTDPKRTLTGSPGASPDHWGGGLNTTATAKGINLGLDAIRYGTGAYITDGVATTDPATFQGFATENDNSSNRWGILAASPGGFTLQGRFVIGQNNSQVAAVCVFEDANVSIVLADTIHSLTDFTQIIIDHASTVVTWDNVSFTALGANNPGRIVVNNASTSVTITGGVWTDIGICTLRAGCDITGTTWRRSGIITQNGATLDEGTFDDSGETHQILADDPGLITACDFISSGSGHAVRCDTTGTYAWSNTDSGYTGSRGSNPTEETGSADAMFYNNSGGLITLNVGAGGQQPSVRNGTGASTVVNATFTLTLTGVPTGVQVTIVNSSTRTELQNSTSTGADITYDHGGGETVDILFMHNDYDPNASDIYSLTLPSEDSSIPIKMIDDLNYENP
jgi:hypothetical protein